MLMCESMRMNGWQLSKLVSRANFITRCTSSREANLDKMLQLFPFEE